MQHFLHPEASARALATLRKGDQLAALEREHLRDLKEKRKARQRAAAELQRLAAGNAQRVRAKRLRDDAEPSESR